MNKTYFSQYDSRWATQLYTAIGNTSQTIKSSGCGPTSAAMVVSSLTNTVVYPSGMAKLFVDNGLRTIGNGTSWAAFTFIASRYGLNCTTTTKLEDAIKCLEKGGMVIASALGSNTALFSTNGHIIVLSGIDNGVIEVMDSALYTGKYKPAYRAKKAKVVGNFVYVKASDVVSECRYYACYTPQVIEVIDGFPKTMTVCNVSTKLNVRKDADINSEVVGKLNNKDNVTVYSYKNNWYNIGSGWVSGDYLADKSGAIHKHIPGRYRVNVRTSLNVRATPADNGKIKSFKELTPNAQEQIKRLKGTEVNGYVNNMVCTVSEVKGCYGKTPSGWVSLDYCVKI